MKKHTKTHRAKTLFVITKSNWGGAQAYVYTIANAIKKTGTDVVVACGGTGVANATTGALTSRLLKAGIRVIPIRSFARDISFLREWSAFFELLSVIRRERPDVLHVNSSKAGGIGALAGRLLGVQLIIFTAHGWPHEEPRNVFSKTLIWLASYATVLLCHTVVVLSARQKEIAPAPLALGKLIIIPNGIENFPLQTRKQARDFFISKIPKLAGYKKWVLSTSEMHPNKGLNTLIKAFANVAKTHSDVALILTNDGEERSRLISTAQNLGISDRVYFTGFISNVRSRLPAADIFVLPSRKEGLPFALLEAGYANVPVIASNVGSIPDLIENDNAGILVPPDDVATLCEALVKLLNDPKYASHLADSLNKHVVRDFSATTMINKTSALYEQTGFNAK